MCGIFGYIGKNEAAPICLQGLKWLEYRGYDSAGIAVIHKSQILVHKEIGKIAELEKAIQKLEFTSSIALTHTRWATHGTPSKKNSHPHVDQHNTLALVHNGVIENYAKIRHDLIEKEHVIFSSETDTEVIAQLFARLYQGDLLKTAASVFGKLEGSFAVALIHKDHPNQMLAVAEKSPLVVGFDLKTREIFVASDSNSFAGRDLDLYFLGNGEIALLEEGKTPCFFTKQGSPFTKVALHETIEQSAISKGEFPHFMLKEIFEQPMSIRAAMLERYDEKEWTAHFEGVDVEKLSTVEHIIIVGCGTSYYAAYVALYLMETIAHISTTAHIASECRYQEQVLFPNTLVIVLSQSGETADTLAVFRHFKEKGVASLALCNVPNSTLAREADSTIFLHAGCEVAVASTKTFTSQITVLYLLTLLLARQRGLSKEDGRKLLKHLYELPEQAEEVLAKSSELQALAKRYAHHENFFFLGRNILYPTAMEAALKLKEIAYINAQGYPSGEMKHGPIALLSPEVPVVVLCTSRFLFAKILTNLMESKARGAPIIVFGWKEFEKEILPCADAVFWIPATSDALACILLTVATQLFAYYVALERGAAIDQPRNLAKSVTVE